MMNDEKEHHLHQLFVKLGHELEQIRQRALSNLIAKLDNGLISLEELANEKYLHVRLLEWFNFPSWPLSKEILMLIKRLIQYQTALESFVELNAIQFLTQLKVHLDEETQSLLDEILISLKSVSNVQTCYQQGCVFYSKSGRRELSDEVSTSLDEATFSFDSYASRKQITYQNISFNSNNVECSHHCFNNSYFPWVSLTAEDKFVLDSSVEWLSSANVDSCNVFIADVLLRDFPAEVFLQRPQIIKALMDMISSKDATLLDESETRMLLESVSTLSSFCDVLSSRIQFHNDLDFSTGTRRMHDDDDLVPLRRPMREEGDRLDESEWRHPLEEQWSVQEFCLNAMERAIPLLSGLDMMIYSKCLRLVSAAAKLLKRSFDKRNLWQHRDHHDNFKQRILSILKKFSTITVSQHRTKSGRLAVCEVTRRQTFFVGLADAFVRLVDDLVDLKEAPVNFQQDCFSYFEMMQQEVFLELGFPGLHERIKSLLSTTNHVPSYESIQSNEVTKSLRCCCRFLNASLKDEKQIGDRSELINLAEQGFMSIREHRSVDFIECSIKLIIKICSDVESSSSDVERCRQLLLRLLACSDVALQSEVYKILQRIIKGTLNIEKFATAKSDLKSDLSVLDCLLDVRIFYEIIAFGFSNLEMKIQETSKDVLLHLLQSKILLTEMTWNKLMTCLQPLAPLLHSYGDESSLAGKFILGMFGDSSVVNVGGVLGKELESVKGSLRIMFHKDLRLRKIGLSSMIRSLMCEENSSKKLPQLSSPEVCQQNDIFLLTFNFGERWNYYNYNIYKESDLKKAMKNFATLDKEAKISSSSQISTILCDPSLHKIFVSCNGLDLILNELREGLLQQKNLEVQLISNLLKCLLSVIVLNSDACERLSRDVSLYLVLFRYAIVFSTRNMAEPQMDVTMIIFLLLFQHSARLIVSWHNNEPPFLDESTIRIPAAISSRYCIPFENHGNYCESSPWATTIFSESSKYDEKTYRKMSERMRVVWNVELCDGDSIKACLGGDDGIKKMRFNTSLNMSDDDKELLRATVPSCGTSFAFSELEGAQSHFAASRAILRISTFLSFQEAGDCLLPIGWTKVLEKFISVAPSSPSDFLFLKDVIALLKLIAIKSSSSTTSNKKSKTNVSTHNWMIQCLLNEAVLGAFSSSNGEDQIRRGLPRKILQLMSHILASCSDDVDNLKHDDGLKRLLDVILLRMSQVEARNSWQLSFLQNLLMVLGHITARSGWSTCDANLCDKVLQLLLKTCVFFHEGRSGVGCSYVGRGVTRLAALCLNHVAFEMANNHYSEEWAERWLHSMSSLSDYADSGLEWLFTLITYRDVEVCVSGLSVATTLSSSETGWRMLIKHTSSSNFQNIWDAALHLLIDENEYHFVRKQATSLVLNLMTHLTNNNDDNNESCQLQSLFVHDRENNVKLVGLPCLTYLLRETKFYEMFASMLNSFTFSAERGVKATQLDDRKTSNNMNNNSLISDVTEDVQAIRGGATNQPRTSPILLASLFDLLHNMLIMAPSDTVRDMHRHQLIKHILRIFSSSLSTVHQNPTILRSESKFFVADLLQFLSSLVDFLCLASNVDEATFAGEVLKDVVFLKHLPLSYAFLKASADDDMKSKSVKLMNSCFNLLIILLNSNVDNSFHVLVKVCDERWSLLKETLLHIFSDAGIFGSDVWFSGIQFMTSFANRESLLAEMNRSSDYVANSLIFNKRLNQSDEKDAREFVESMVGMLKSFDFKSSELLQHKMLILDAFKALSSISSTFRTRAFRAGILNIFMDDLQRTSLTLSTDFDSLSEKKTDKSGHKKAKTALKEVQKTIEALQSLMMQIPEAKMAACRRDLAGVLASLWKWCLNSASLMSSALSLLTCFTAHSSEATSSLVNTNVNKHQAPNGSFFVCLLKFTQKEFSAPKKGSMLLLKAFQLLGNLITNSGCRSILAKSTFLTETAGLIKSRNKKQISQTTEEILWLKFLAGLSFFGDGQLMILKTEDILSILLEQGGSNFLKTSCQLSTLTIRNLCFHHNRAKLLSNDKVVTFLLKCLNEESDHLTSMACSALLVLLTCSQKLKVNLKNNMAVMKRLQDLLEKQGSKSEVLGKFSLRQSLQDMITIIDG